MRASAGPGWRRSLIINAIGASATGIVVVVILTSKFDRGAWVVVLLVPLFVLMFRAINRHYARVGKDLGPSAPIHVEDLHHVAIVPISRLNPPHFRALRTPVRSRST